MREYVTKDVGFWPGGDHLRRVRKTSYARSYAQHPVEEKILDYLEPGLVLLTVLVFVGSFLVSYYHGFYHPGNHRLAVLDEGAGKHYRILGSIANAIIIGGVGMFIFWLFYRLIPRLMGYRRVPQWELHAERRAELLATLDEKERARYLLDEDARDQAYRRGVATGYVAGRNSGRWNS